MGTVGFMGFMEGRHWYWYCAAVHLSTCRSDNHACVVCGLWSVCVCGLTVRGDCAPLKPRLRLRLRVVSVVCVALGSAPRERGPGSDADAGGRVGAVL